MGVAAWAAAIGVASSGVAIGVLSWALTSSDAGMVKLAHTSVATANLPAIEHLRFRFIGISLPDHEIAPSVVGCLALHVHGHVAEKRCPSRRRLASARIGTSARAVPCGQTGRDR